MSIHYRNLKCSQMPDTEVKKTIDLFGRFYGVWAENDKGLKVGQHIKMPFIKSSIVEKPDRFIAIAYDDERMIGYSYYLRRKTKPTGRMVTWILQLVVDEAYRGKGIGTKIMHSIWGMSDSWAWGLYTSNPFTIKCLQDATMRKVRKGAIQGNLKELRTVAEDLFDDLEWIDSYQNGLVNTNFPIDHRKAEADFKEKYPFIHFDLPEELPVGYEWLAFVFNDQLAKPNEEQLRKYLGFSEDVNRDAYSKMDMDHQAWASHTNEEVEFIIEALGNPSSILDLGCGRGRHCIALAEKGIDVLGVDNNAIPEEGKYQVNQYLQFLCDDARYVKVERKFDSVIALYDVIGSNPKEEENLRILKNAFDHLKNGGKLLISVMNMKVTKDSSAQKGNVIHDISKPTNLKKLIHLKGSNTMQASGQVFDGALTLVDDDTGICYRKEIFMSEDYLPIEYVVEDRRYTLKGIQKLVKAAGFVIEKAYCFRAGKLGKPMEDGKEIMVIARKGSIVKKVFRSKKINECWK